MGIMFVGMGSGLIVLNNSNQMVKAIGGDQNSNAILVSLISIASCFGRISFGVAPDVLGSFAPRPVFIALNCMLMVLAHALLSFATMPGLWSGAVLAGFSYGGFWTLGPSMISEIFGTKHFATLYNFMSLAVSLGSLVFSSL